VIAPGLPPDDVEIDFERKDQLERERRETKLD
jgi:hypothetical protein